MNTDGSIELIFSKNLNADLNTNLLTFRNEDQVYDSSTFILIIIEPRKRYNIRLNNILLTGFNMMTLYFPTGTDILISDYNDNLATQYLDINIIAESITNFCSSISNCLTCSKIGEDFRCDSCVYPSCLYPSQGNRCGECCDVGTYHNEGVCEACPSACKVCYSNSVCTECVSNAMLVEGVCRCGSNYSNIDGACINIKGLRAAAEMENNGVIILTFDNTLLAEISDTSIQFLIQDTVLNSSSFIISELETQKTYAISIKSLSLLGISSITLLFIDSSSILSSNLIPLQDNQIDIPVPIEVRCKSSNNSIVSPNICEICPDVCLECSESGCISCDESYFLLNSSCVSKCPSGYIKDSKRNECIRCDIDNCLLCDYMTEMRSTTCIECEDNYILMTLSGKGSCMAYSDSTELENEICTSCRDQCNEYKGDISCNICLNNTEIVYSSCVISPDVIETDIRELNLLTPTLRYSSNNQLNLAFDKPLIKDLNKDYITLHVNDLQYNPDKFTINIEQIHQNYRIILQDIDISIPNTVTIFFTKTFSGYQSSYLSKLSLYIPFQDKLDSKDNQNTSESEYSSEQIAQGNKAREISESVTTASSVSITVSIASGGTYAWSFLNTIQIFSYLNLLQVKMPLILKSYIESQEDYYISYNLLQNIMNDSQKPYKKAQDFKYPYSNLVLNTGKPLFILYVIICIHLLSKISLRFAKGKLKLLLNKVSMMFSYGVYLRFLIQMYIEFSVPALLQLLYV